MITVILPCWRHMHAIANHYVHLYFDNIGAKANYEGLREFCCLKMRSKVCCVDRIHRWPYEHISFVNLFRLFFFPHGFSHHIGSPVWPMTFLLHVSRSISSPALSQYFSSVVGTRLSVVFSVVLSSFSLVYPLWTLSSVHLQVTNVREVCPVF